MNLFYKDGIRRTSAHMAFKALAVAIIGRLGFSSLSRHFGERSGEFGANPLRARGFKYADILGG